jgi:Uma2 family endonuclease
LSQQTTDKTIKVQIECSIAPELCIKVISNNNSQQEMDEKKALYVAQGAEKFWLCDENGNIRFFDTNGQLTHSMLAPNFPHKIDL